MVDGRLARSESTGPSSFFEDRTVEEKDGVEGLVLSRSGHAGYGQAVQEGFDLLFRREGFELWVSKQRGIAAKQVGVGSFGVD